MRGTWRGGSFTGDPENMLSKALEVSVSKGGPFFGKMEGRFLGPLREGIFFLFMGNFYE